MNNWSRKAGLVVDKKIQQEICILFPNIEYTEQEYEQQKNIYFP